MLAGASLEVLLSLRASGGGGVAMAGFVDALAVIGVFGMPLGIVIANRYYKFREKQLEHESAQRRLPASPGESQALERVEKEKRLLEERVQNLESIVCSVDFELNQRLNRLAAGVSLSQRLPAADASSFGGVAPAPVRPSVARPLPSSALAGAPRGSTLARRATPPSTSAASDPAGFDETQVVHRLGYLDAGQVVLGRYRIERELGRGGMGAVYLALDARLGERVALKVISSVRSDDPAQAVARFHREVQAARKVTHPNVVRIHDIGEDGPLLFLSMEYIAGETLAEWVRRTTRVTLADATAILSDVALGVAAAHAVGVVHRDLKPQNVLLGGEGPTRVVKVIDFGLASTSFLAGMTATGMILGTPEYMAPEQLRGAPCDARSDVYALGAMGYHVVCGRPPFVGDTPIAVGFAHLREPPRPPRELRPDLPEGIERTLLRALAKEPAERFADAAAFRAALLAPG